MIEYRARNKIAEEDMEEKVGKILLREDISLLATGKIRILKPDGSPLAVYLPGAISQELRADAYPILQSLKNSYTSNRGLASGSKRVQGASSRSYARAVDSAIIGAFDATGPKQYCRLTAWTGREQGAWRGLWPLLRHIGELLAENVPDRYANQVRQAQATSPEWVIPGTPFTTVTVNHTYPTGVHKDKGDLDGGFSTLCFPEYRLGVEMQDCDLLLMDAHAWHGNTQFIPEPQRDKMGHLVGDPGFERISVVSYFRTRMVDCGSADDEAERAKVYAENRNSALVGE